MPGNSEWTIDVVPPEQISEVVTFVMQARAQMFPKLNDSGMPPDLRDFARVYRPGGSGCFLQARHDGRLLAVVGYVPYDHRFAQLDYHGRRTVEVVRLFVEPQWRRAGLAAALCTALTQAAARAGVEVLYLHTHPFLPGAIRFWEQQGFVVVDIEDDPLWQTTHMQRELA